MRTAVLSDIHGNLPALEAVLNDIESQGCERAYVLGDIINGPSPRECLERVMALPILAGVIKGNAELYLLTPDLDHLPGKEETENRDLIGLMRWYRQHLSDRQIAWLASLPETIACNHTILAHDSPLDRLEKQRWQRPGLMQQYQEWFFHALGIHEAMPADQWRELTAWMDARGFDRLFIGHTHEPFIKRVDGKVICNAGSAGFTLDGDPRLSWVLIEEDHLAIRRVEYDIQKALALVDEAGYPIGQNQARREAYKKMLLTGWHWRVHLQERQ